MALSVSRLGKQYRMAGRGAGYATLRDDLASIPGRVKTWLSAGRKSVGDSDEKYLWALRDVSFDVAKGEAIGIIGKNGAGKSTLLKILSRITNPTVGEARIRGQVGSLLEVGTGFHPELTGAENVFLNGAILGMSHRDIVRRFHAIVEFAELERFVDTPVKFYSSGMYTRLAFAVAAHLEPEVLIVDEVLAVGDMDFQRRCLSKMHDVTSGGRTVLFVSHNMQAISTLTERTVVLDHGRLVYAGPTGEAIREYLRYGEKRATLYEVDDPNPQTGVVRVEVETSEPGGTHVHAASMSVTVDIFAPAGLRRANVSLFFLGSLNDPVSYQWTPVFDWAPASGETTLRLRCVLPKVRLYEGSYTVTLNFSEEYGRKHAQKIERICPFEVVMHGHYHDFGWTPGACKYIEDTEWKASAVRRTMDAEEEIQWEAAPWAATRAT